MYSPLLWFSLLATYLNAQSPVDGVWYAVLRAGDQEIPLNVELIAADEGWAGGLLSPTQSPNRIPFTTVAVTEDSLSFSIAPLQITFTGKLTEARIDGRFQQGGFGTELVFTRDRPAGYPTVTGEASGARPQEPTDFPYANHEVTFPGGASGVEIAGTLTLPAAGPPRALLLLVAGSGPQDRNEDLGPPINHRPFLVLSDYLTRRGYGVLRYDKRGVAESTGDYARSTTRDFADDAAAALAFLRGMPDIGKLPTGILGHSEGGIVGPMIAAESADVDFLILLAAPGLAIDSLMLEQRRAITGTVLPDEPVLSLAYTFTKENGQLDSAAFAEGLRRAVVNALPELPESLRRSITDPETFAKAYVDALSPPWMRYFFTINPASYLRQVTVPVLAVNGTLDRQVDPANLAAIAAALRGAGNRDVAVQLLPGLNHLLQPATTGLPAEYGSIETTIAPEALDLIGQWLDERFGR
ncbi:S9 family peptidase [Lewinella sp. JB7]|uniref:alpha/beta hydrolase family protein n=1 Tax=Lewinella sp. JB7 TaxID=2962887 RepID=UPI0020C99F5C|nr:alpha/beta fold hydrolase [Lewinella sp. JB7]MCP9236442.1 alpha/beta hydrolase [Lewinella sp. JB7]